MKRFRERDERIQQHQFTRLRKLWKFILYFIVGVILLGLFGQSMAVGFVRYQIKQGNWGTFDEEVEIINAENSEEKVTA